MALIGVGRLRAVRPGQVRARWLGPLPFRPKHGGRGQVALMRGEAAPWGGGADRLGRCGPPEGIGRRGLLRAWEVGCDGAGLAAAFFWARPGTEPGNPSGICLQVAGLKGAIRIYILPGSGEGLLPASARSAPLRGRSRLVAGRPGVRPMGWRADVPEGSPPG